MRQTIPFDLEENLRFISYRYCDNDWKEALGSGINGLITGATRGGLFASGAGIPAALFANTLAGTAGSAAEQYIGSGKIDAGKSITSGLNNAVSNAIYGTKPLGSVKEAFGRGAGAATSALHYISDTLGEKTLHSRMGLLSGMTGAAFSPYNFLREVAVESMIYIEKILIQVVTKI